MTAESKEFDRLPLFQQIVYMSMSKGERDRFKFYAVNRGIPLEDALDEWIKKHADPAEALRRRAQVSDKICGVALPTMVGRFLCDKEPCHDGRHRMSSIPAKDETDWTLVYSNERPRVEPRLPDARSGNGK